MKELSKMIPLYDVISFDIFDTLLLRPFLRASDLWKTLGADFAEARQAADRGGYDTLEDAYALMGNVWHDMRARELDFERRSLIANPEMVALWNLAGDLGKKRVIVSDMYLPQPFLEDVLENCEIKGWNGFYLSCVRKARKDDGTLFGVMLKEQCVKPERVLHIGDNPHSDVHCARRLGIRAVHYKSVSDRFVAENPFVTKFLKRDGGLPARCLVGALAIAWHQYRFTNPNATYWTKIGLTFGSVLAIAYLKMIASSVREQRLERLLFVARDGYALEKIFNVMHPGVKTTYVYAPRLIQCSEDPAPKEEYRKYLNSVGITEEKIGIVDSVSLGFSAQRLIAGVLGRDVFGFYVLTAQEPPCGKSFICAHNHTLTWAHFVEFLFMAPYPPTLGINANEPIFPSILAEDEQKKIDIYPDVVNGEMYGAEFLNKFLCENGGFEITAGTWMDYIDSFISAMSRDDQKKLSMIKNAVDAEHRHYVPILRKLSEWVWCTWKKLPYKLRRNVRCGNKRRITEYLFGVYKLRDEVMDI